jgi:uncharacterized Zn finger protein
MRTIEDTMPKKKTPLERFTELTWGELEVWAGAKITSRGKNYQRRGCVSELAVTDDGALLAWVEGSKRYATKVSMDDDGLPESICSCPYAVDCKHGVAVVLDYLSQLESKRCVPKAKANDKRLKLLETDEWDNDADIDDDDTVPAGARQTIDQFLKAKSKAQLIALVHELACQYPEITRTLCDRQLVTSGNAKALVTRLLKEIREVGAEPGWRNHWDNEGFTPDYSGIRIKLETLLKGGHADDMLTAGRELIASGIRQVEESHDEGETAMEVAACMPLIVEALGRSSLEAAERLTWSLDAVLEDPFDICEAFGDYLHKEHPPSAWNAVADRLLVRLKEWKVARGANDFTGNYTRNTLSDWAIHALERAERDMEIIPLCEAEAGVTGNYDRLVRRLIAAGSFKTAEQWIQKGIAAAKEKRHGTAARLRDRLEEIRTFEKNWPALAAMQVEAFVRQPSIQAYRICKKTSERIKQWPLLRGHLLGYLETGKLPWEQKGWPLPESGLERPDAGQPKQYPRVSHLIDIAIHEKKPDQVLRWYDQRPKSRFGEFGIDDDAVATAIKNHAPDRAVVIWKQKAEAHIAQVKPGAYLEAAKFLQKASAIMTLHKKLPEWEVYLKALRQQHARKSRLMEVLDGLAGKPIVLRR